MWTFKQSHVEHCRGRGADFKDETGITVKVEAVTPGRRFHHQGAGRGADRRPARRARGAHQRRRLHRSAPPACWPTSPTTSTPTGRPATVPTSRSDGTVTEAVLPAVAGAGRQDPGRRGGPAVQRAVHDRHVRHRLRQQGAARRRRASPRPRRPGRSSSRRSTKVKRDRPGTRRREPRLPVARPPAWSGSCSPWRTGARAQTASTPSTARTPATNFASRERHAGARRPTGRSPPYWMPGTQTLDIDDADLAFAQGKSRVRHRRHVHARVPRAERMRPRQRADVPDPGARRTARSSDLRLAPFALTGLSVSATTEQQGRGAISGSSTSPTPDVGRAVRQATRSTCPPIDLGDDPRRRARPGARRDDRRRSAPARSAYNPGDTALPARAYDSAQVGDVADGLHAARRQRDAAGAGARH